MKDKATLLFLTLITYAGIVACLLTLTPLGAPGPDTAVAIKDASPREAAAGAVFRHYPGHRHPDRRPEAGPTRVS